MRIRILLFAALREKAGTHSIDLDLQDGARLAVARTELERRYPEILKNVRAATAVNGKYERDETRELVEGDEVAFLPPVSGG
jgi:molybdopterin converting factor subunit 1